MYGLTVKPSGLDLDDAAALAGVSAQAVLDWIARGEVKAERSPWRVTVDAASLEANIRRLQNPTCNRCGTSWERPIRPGRRPTLCPACRGGSRR